MAFGSVVPRFIVRKLPLIGTAQLADDSLWQFLRLRLTFLYERSPSLSKSTLGWCFVTIPEVIGYFFELFPVFLQNSVIQAISWI